MLCVILDETIRLEKIVDDLLLLAQVESGRLQLHRRRTLAHSLIEQAVSGMDVAQPKHEIEYEVVPPSLTVSIAWTTQSHARSAAQAWACLSAAT